MHILYIHQYFETPQESASTRSYWFAKKLIEEGHKVTMITGTNDNQREAKKVNIDGINVIYVKNNYNQRFNKVRKVYSFTKFIFQSILQAHKIKNVDLVFATSTPLSVGAIALYLYWFKKLNYVFEVRDLWPEFPIQIGAIKNKIVISILKRFEKLIYKNSSHIISLSPGMKDGVLRAGINKNKVSMIPNMSKPDLFYPRPISAKHKELLNLKEESLNVIHFGAMGIANGLEYLIDTAKYLSDNKQSDKICFYVVGDGATLPLLKEKVKELNLTNVKFPGKYNLYDMAEVVNCCDISFVSFKNLPILYTNSPNKLFDSLSAGKLIIVNSAGWTKDMVEQYDCGYYVDPEHPKVFGDLLMNIDKTTRDFQEKSANSRKISIDVYDKKILCAELVTLLESTYEKISNNKKNN